MALQKSLVPVAMSGGLDTKTDPAQLQMGSLLTLQNGLFTNPGRIIKRTGSQAFGKNIQNSSSNSSIQAAQALQIFNDELLLCDGNNIYSYLEQTGQWLNKGTAISVINTDSDITRLVTAQQANPDASYLFAIKVYAYEDTRNSGSIRYAVVDANTNAIIVNDTEVSASSTRPKLIAYDGLVYLFYLNNNGLIVYQTINPYNPTLITSPTTPTFYTDGYAGTPYDVTVVGNDLCVAYLGTHFVSGELTVIKINQSAFKLFVATDIIASDFVVNITGDSSNNMWISWYNFENINCVCFTPTGIFQVPVGTATIVASNCQTLTGTVSDGLLYLCYEVDQSSVSYNQLTYLITVSYATGTLTSIATQRSVGLASKAFQANGNLYVNLTYDSSSTSTNEQCTYFTALINSSGFTIIGKINSQVGGGLRTNHMLSECVPVAIEIIDNIPTPITTPTVFIWANLVKGPVISQNATLFSALGVNSTQMDFDNSNKFLSVQFSNNLLIVGGILQIYDGVSVVEQGFHIYPEGLSISLTGSSGSLSAGVYSWCACYAWTDNFGQVHRSSPSPVIVATASSNNTASIVVPTLRITNKVAPRGPVVIELYRTQVNASGVNPTFYLVTSVTNPIQNNTGVDSITITDGASDTTIASNAFLYTTGGILDNIAAPANSLITLYQDRVILGGLEDPNVLWYSQNRQEIDNFNTTPVEFCAENTIGVDPRGGSITALALLNQNLIIFKKDTIFTISGDGTNNTGGGTPFPDAQMISSDVGCINPNSINIRPTGLIFQSGKGMYQLDSGFNLTYIGAPVEAFNSLTITSATTVPDKNYIIFTTNSTTALTYDYYVGQWGTFTNYLASDAVIFQELFTWVSPTGTVYQTDPSVYYDNSSPISLSFTTPNFAFSSVLNGYQRVYKCYLLGQFQSPHTLTVNVAYDYSPVYTQQVVITPVQNITASVWGSDSVWGASSPWGGQYNIYEYRIDFQTQQCTAIRLQIFDTPVAGSSGQGYGISALTFEVGIATGGNRLPYGQIVGTQ
jgi:hypothetical protein